MHCSCGGGIQVLEKKNFTTKTFRFSYLLHWQPYLISPALVLSFFNCSNTSSLYLSSFKDSTFQPSLFEENKMSSSPNYVCCHRNRLLVVLLFLLVSSLTQVTFMAAEGRSLSRLLEVAQKETEEEDKPFMMRSLIGSRPPRCERKCSSWPNCEAIQVPVTTLLKNRRDRHFSAALFSISFSKGDDISNYKPMSWKCKCGNLICNP